MFLFKLAAYREGRFQPSIFGVLSSIMCLDSRPADICSKQADGVAMVTQGGGGMADITLCSKRISVAASVNASHTPLKNVTFLFVLCGI